VGRATARRGAARANMSTKGAKQWEGPNRAPTGSSSFRFRWKVLGLRCIFVWLSITEFHKQPFSTMPMPKFALASPGSLASQRISRLEGENEALRKEIFRLREEMRAYSKKGSSTEWVQVPIPPRRNITCSFCRKSGHHLDQCVSAFVDRINKMHSHCEYGCHSPYQHGGEWRCNWCGKHLNEQEVKSFPGWQRRVRSPTPEWESESGEGSDASQSYSSGRQGKHSGSPAKSVKAWQTLRSAVGSGATTAQLPIPPGSFTTQGDCTEHQPTKSMCAKCICGKE